MCWVCSPSAVAVVWWLKETPCDFSFFFKLTCACVLLHQSQSLTQTREQAVSKHLLRAFLKRQTLLWNFGEVFPNNWHHIFSGRCKIASEEPLGNHPAWAMAWETQLALGLPSPLLYAWCSLWGLCNTEEKSRQSWLKSFKLLHSRDKNKSSCSTWVGR